jgi:hypothetical protein
MGFLGTDRHTLNLPNITLVAGDIGGVLVLPQIQLIARDADGYAELTVPNITVTAEWIISEVGHMTATVPMIQLIADGTTGTIGHATLVLPNITLTAHGDRMGSAVLVVPQIQLNAYGCPEVTWDNTLTLPQIQLLASGTTNVTDFIGSTDYQVWTMNSVTGAHTTYSSWNVNSYGKFDGREIIVLADGIYEVTGVHDASAEILADVEWPPTDMGSHKQKRIDSISINMRSLTTDGYTVTAVADEQQLRRYPKTITGRPEGMRRHRQLLPKGLNGQHWQFGFENDTGGDFVLDEIEVIAVELTRRFK